jgi:Raf kinase inhibitor-like YbhB/YbcL family protein
LKIILRLVKINLLAVKRIILLLILILLAAAGFYYYYINNPYFQGKNVNQENKVSDMIIKSSAFKENALIPAKYTCDGQGINPPLEINNVPYGTKSLALIVEDPDSPMGNFTHWVMFNINPYTKEIPENFNSSNVTFGKNDFGNIGFGGPCPGTGTHRYKFELFALNNILLLQRGATKAEVLNNIQGLIIEKAETTGTYKKQ